MILTNILFFLIFLIFNIRSQDSTQTHKPLTLDIVDNGKNEVLQTFYYTLTIPSDVPANMNLAIRVKESDLADEGKEDFSDPDIYVSKTNKYPSNPENSRWFSERYGEDMINIPKSEIISGVIFYIGVFCERKCNYEIVAKLENEYEIVDGEVYQTFIQKEYSISFTFKARSEYEEMEIIAYSENLQNFKIYVGKNTLPSDQDTILAIPSWVGGYSVIINKDSDDYCTDCNYYIVIEAPLADTHVFFYIKYEETVTKVRSTEPIFSTLRPYKEHCYKINIAEGDKKENLIIQVALFSGSLILKSRPWKMPTNTTDYDISYIFSEKVIKISPEARKAIDMGNNNNETGDFYYCVNTYEYTSYVLKAYFERDVEQTQKFSLLYRGKLIDGYLPSNKALRYRILEFEARSNLTVTLQSKSGNPTLYGYICDDMRTCQFTKQRVQDEITKNKMILSEKFSIFNVLEIDDSINTCHQNIEKDDTQISNINNIRCAALAVVVCDGSEECEYSIRTSRDDVSIHLQPRKTHFQILPYDDHDYYTITINDNSITNLNIVMNSITGDADMSVSFIDTNGNLNNQKTVAISENAPYLPDVVRINKETLGKDNLIGSYNITVYASSFASYSIYYYTANTNSTINGTDSSGAIPSLPILPPTSAVTAELFTGQIIKDFIDIDSKYKIYAYNPRASSDLDIRITLTPERSQYAIYVLLNLTDLVYNETNLYHKIQNYNWSSLYNNELIIRKTDPSYSRDKTYYIVIVKQSKNSNSSITEHIPSYWIGVTNEFYPFLLFEGVPQTSTLDNTYSSQTYWYTHSNTSNPFSLSVNVFYGRVNVYADFAEIRNFNRTTIPLQALDTDTSYLTIPSEKLKAGCIQQNNCGIYIYVNKSSSYDTQYLLVAKSNPSQPEVLTSGVIRHDTMSAGEVRKYNIVLDKKFGSVVMVTFESGYGDVYLNVPKVLQATKKATYPTREKFDYKADDFYLGKIINLSHKAFEDCDPCQIAVSVYGRNLGIADDQIEFTISYYDQARKLNQNQPLRGHITQGEIQFFNVFFGKAENIYVSLTNMDGDVDMFMNFGNDLPTFENSTWASRTIYNEFIEFNKDDNFFVTNKITELNGNYTLMLYGFTNSTYTLYLTSHPKKILPISTSSPASCKAKAGEACYFRYDDFEDYDEQLDADFDFVVTTDYLFGSGVIYASLYKDTDYDIMDDFPCANSFDFNSVNANSRNLLKFKLNRNNTKLTKDSMILLTVECKDNCFFDLNMVKMFNSDIQYLDLYRENLFYIYKAETGKNVLVFYNWRDKNINYNIFAYEGKANFKIYTNETNYDSTSGLSGYKINDIYSFAMDSKNGENYHNSIRNKDYDTTYKSIYFAVDPITDFGFYLKLSYELEWTKIKVGKVNSFMLNSYSREFYGFFDMMEDYEYVVVTVSCDSPDVSAYVYMRYNYIDKKDSNVDKSNPYNYFIPSNINAEFSGNTDQILNSVSIKVPKPTHFTGQDKFIRVLMTLNIFDLSYGRNSTDTKVSLMISPSTNGLSIIEAEQFKYIFSVFQAINTDIKIYDLKKKESEDDLLVIEMSSCVGDFNYKISDKMNFNSKDIVSVEHTEDISGGRILVKVNLKGIMSDSFYLTLLPREAGKKDCFKSNGKYICEELTVSMFYYYTTTEEKYKNSFSNGKGSLEVDDVKSDSVNIKWKKILTMDENKNINVARASYKVFVTNNLFDFNHMESVCYLSRMNQTSTMVETTLLEDSIHANIYNLIPDKKYFVNVLARNLDTNDVIAFQPVEFIAKGASIPMFYIVVTAMLILVLIFLVWFFYKKFRITKDILKYEINDVRNMSTLPKSEHELRDLAKDVANRKYAHLVAENSGDSSV